MCLTGVDYFSTLGYQPGIAFLAAGALSPLATLVLVLVTLFGALPTYAKVAESSPFGEGSISMLERHLSWWKGKLFVLALLGFASTDFIITITLSASDAAAHLAENPLTPEWMGHRLGVSSALVVILGLVFWRGFQEAIGLAVVLVVAYLGLNLVLLVVCLVAILGHPLSLHDWWTAVHEQQPTWTGLILVLVMTFPQLALGLSGFETGVAVMPLVRGWPSDSTGRPIGRIHETRKLLFWAALVMSFYLLASSLVTTVLIPARAFSAGGAANGRALAYLAHERLGPYFGTCYDLVTIGILWFAGASALAGLLNLVPRYLPRYGMAPEWSRQRHPMVVLFTLLAVLVLFLFRASVDAQGGAYATGVLALMTSAAVAVSLDSTGWTRRAFQVISVAFIYTTLMNIYDRPDGLKIALCFISAIVFASMVSRMYRSTELRITHVELDEAAREIIEQGPEKVRLIPLRPGHSQAEFAAKAEEQAEIHGIPEDAAIIFLEVGISDASNFGDLLKVTGHQIGPHRLLRTSAPAVANAAAALLLYLRDLKGTAPHIYFGWREGNPFLFLLSYLAFGEGDIAITTREVLRRQEKDVNRRPRVHVG